VSSIQARVLKPALPVHPPDFGRQPWPHSATSAPMAPEGEYPPEPEDSASVFWVELPSDLSPYVRLGMRVYAGERHLILRLVRELGDPEAYAEIEALPEQVLSLAQTLVSVCAFVRNCDYGTVQAYPDGG
jgi:hypothetical protein